MTRLTLLIGLTLALVGTALGQQESQYSSYMYNQLYYNPAYAGSRGMPTVTGLYRQQWAGFEGAPTSQMISFNSPLVSDALGFGVQLNHATKGITDNVFASMAYNYKVKLSEVHSVRLGLQGSVQRWAVDFTDESVRVRSADDQSIDLANNFSTWEGNVGLGAYLQLEDYFSAGVSVPRIYNSKISVDESKGDRGAQVSPHIYFTAEGMIPLANNLAFRPSALVKMVQGAPTDFDINLSMVYAQRVMGGVGYRVGGDGEGESINLLLFYQTSDKLGIGGAYDVGMSDLSSQTGGSFEILARFDFGSERDDLVNPRFF